MSETPPVVALPSGFAWGYVTGRVIHAIGDTTADTDRDPEARAGAGRIVFTPKARDNRAHGAFIIYEDIVVDLDSEGYIVNAHSERQPVALLTGMYGVAFKLASGQLPAFDILITADHTQESPLDLVSVAPQSTFSTLPTTVLKVPQGMFPGAHLGWSPSDGLAWFDPGAAIHVGDTPPADTSMLWVDTSTLTQGE